MAALWRPWGRARRPKRGGQTLCAGLFYARAHAPHAADVVRRWWDISLPGSNLVGFYEQDALWEALDKDEVGRGDAAVPAAARLSYASISIVHEPAMVRESEYNGTRWARHVTYPDRGRRREVLRPYLERAGYDAARFGARVQELETRGLVRLFNVLDAARAMQVARNQTG